MSSYTAPPPTITEFISELSKEIDWYVFGTFMGVPTSELDMLVIRVYGGFLWYLHPKGEAQGMQIP